MSLLAVVESLDQVDERVRDFYEQKSENEFVLKVEGLPQPVVESNGQKLKEKSLLDQVAALKKANAEAERRAQELERKAQEEKDAALAASGDFKQIAASEKKRADEREKAYQDLLKSIEQEKEQMMIDGFVNPLCAKLFGDGGELISESIKKKIKVVNMDLDGLEPKKSIGFVQEDGSILTSSSDIENYIKSNSKYSKFITASLATGAAAKGSVGSVKQKPVNPINDLPVSKQAMANLSAWATTLGK